MLYSPIINNLNQPINLQQTHSCVLKAAHLKPKEYDRHSHLHILPLPAKGVSLKVIPVSPGAPAGVIFPEFSHLPKFSISKLTVSDQPAVLQRITNLSLTYGGSWRYCYLYFTQGEGRDKQRGKFLKLLNDCETEVIFKRELGTPELKLTLHVLQSHPIIKPPQFTSGKVLKATQGPEECHNRKFQV